MVDKWCNKIIAVQFGVIEYRVKFPYQTKGLLVFSLVE